eukprot:3805287-Alexandrium_andersonii.AAC.1
MAAVATSPGRASRTARTTAEAGWLLLSRKSTPGRQETSTSTAPAALVPRTSMCAHVARARALREGAGLVGVDGVDPVVVAAP